MKFIDYKPSLPLQPFINSIKIIESGKDMISRVWPETSQVMVFRAQGHVNTLIGNVKQELPNLVITGLKKSVRYINYNEHSANILVMFKEAGTAAFFKEPLHELFEETVALDNYIPRSETSIVEEQLSLAKTYSEKIRIVEGFLLSKLRNPDPDKLILAALEKIHSVNGFCRIKDLTASLYISQDAFEKRFRRIVGASPKQFASIVRMRNILSLKHKTTSLTELALDAGFFDQSHFNKEFQLFTGLIPSDYFKTSRS